MLSDARTTFESELDRLMLCFTRSTLFTTLLSHWAQVVVEKMKEPSRSVLKMGVVVQKCREREIAITAAHEASMTLAANLNGGRSRLPPDADPSDACTLSRQTIEEAMGLITSCHRASTRYLAGQLELSGAMLEMKNLVSRSERIVARYDPGKRTEAYSDLSSLF